MSPSLERVATCVAPILLYYHLEPGSQQNQDQDQDQDQRDCFEIVMDQFCSHIAGNITYILICFKKLMVGAM